MSFQTRGVLFFFRLLDVFAALELGPGAFSAFAVHLRLRGVTESDGEERLRVLLSSIRVCTNESRMYCISHIHVM